MMINARLVLAKYLHIKLFKNSHKPLVLFESYDHEGRVATFHAKSNEYYLPQRQGKTLTQKRTSPAFVNRFHFLKLRMVVLLLEYEVKETLSD